MLVACPLLALSTSRCLSSPALYGRARLLWAARQCGFSTATTAHEPVRLEVPCGGRNLLFTVGELARFSDGSVTVQDRDTTVLATVVSKEATAPSPAATASADSPTAQVPPPPSMVPLTVNYQQRAAAAGRIPSNFLRREMGASDTEILTGRAIDRSLRPLFPEGFSAKTHVTCQVLAADGLHMPDVLAVNAASVALACSPVPWQGPVAAVRVGWLDSGPVVNPTRCQLAASQLDLLVSVTRERNVVMLEGTADDMNQSDFISAIKTGVKEASAIVRAMEQLQRKLGVVKRDFVSAQLPESVCESVEKVALAALTDILSDANHDKLSRDEALQAVRREAVSAVCETLGGGAAAVASEAFTRLLRQQLRRRPVEQGLRCDGRQLHELRPLSSRVGLYRPLHGSALFQRGQTQVLATVAFDSPDSELRAAHQQQTAAAAVYGSVRPKNFMLHYDFPSYATAELGGPQRGPGRREIGHGALAERALRAVVPDDFPFAIRLSTEVLESNGSSSMASVCAGSMALMDAGVRLASPVAGVAVGLITSYDQESGETAPAAAGDKRTRVAAPAPAAKSMSFTAPAPLNSIQRQCRYTLLTDLLGIEDYFGDMDLKIACTYSGVTAIQADFKVAGVPMKLIVNAIMAGRTACAHLLTAMHTTISEPRRHSDTWPQLDRLTVPPHHRAHLLGVGGINLRRLTAVTGVQVTAIDDTTFSVFAPSAQAMSEGRQQLQQLLAACHKQEAEASLEFGAVYHAEVLELRDSGVMVRLRPGLAPALVHNSQLDQRPVRHPSALGIQIGDHISVKYFGRDPTSGQMRLSRKAVTSLASPVVKDLTPREDPVKPAGLL